MALAPTEDVTALGVVPAVDPADGEEGPALLEAPASTDAGEVKTSEEGI
jgi:hypothetical protein